MTDAFIKNTIKQLGIVLILLCSIAPLTAVQATPKEADFKKSLSVVNSKMSYTQHDDYNSISSIGTIENRSNIKWKYLVLEVQFFNANDELIDTLTEEKYGMTVPPNDTIAFRLSGQADKAKSEYVSHKVRITSAEQVTKCKPKSKNIFFKLLTALLPLAIVILVLVIFVKKAQGKNSPQSRIIENQEKTNNIMEETNRLIKEQHTIQNAIMEKQNDILKEIADAMRNK